MAHVLVVGAIHRAGMERLEAASDLTFEVIDQNAEAAYPRRMGDADALIIRTQKLTAAIIDQATKLRIVSRHGVGYDSVDVEALSARRIPLSVVGDVNSSTVAEHSFALLLALAKQVQPYDAAVRNGNWPLRDGLIGHDLAGKTLLIIGFGRIGRHLARLGEAFGMRITAYDPHVEPAAMLSGGAEPVSDLHAGLAEADAVSVHAPKVGGQPLLGAGELAHMRPTAWLINTARGGIVDEAALAEALAAEQIAGAGIDVFTDEPPPPDHPLLGAPRCLLSPHIAGLTEECAARMAVASADNVVAALAGTLDPSLVVNADAIGWSKE